MTTSEPPEPGRHQAPGSGPDRPADPGEGADRPAGATPGPAAGPESGTSTGRGTGAASGSGTGTGSGAEAGSAAIPAAHQGEPAGTNPVPPAAATPRRGRRRPWLIAGAVVLGVLLLLAAFGAGRATGRWHDGGHFGRGEHWGQGRMHDGPGGPGMLGERGDGGFGGFGPGRHDRGGPGAGQAVVGTVASVNGPSLVVNTDGAGPVTVTTNAQTRVVGELRHSVADLKPGDRVVVRVRDANTAVGVLVPPARAAGTVTALDGDRATVTRMDGLTQAVDVSGVTNKPKVGDRIEVQGVIADNGATLKANSLRVLPK